MIPEEAIAVPRASTHRDILFGLDNRSTNGGDLIWFISTNNGLGLVICFDIRRLIPRNIERDGAGIKGGRSVGHVATALTSRQNTY